MDTPPLTLQARRIYILPTRAGVTAAGLLFLMLLAGMNYSNSLALLLCFMLSAWHWCRCISVMRRSPG